MTTRPILAADVGGTKTALGLFRPSGDGVHPLARAVYPSAGTASLEDLVCRFLSEQGVTAIAAAGFGVAGPVMDGHAQGVNLPWPVDRRSLAARLDCPAVTVVNDLAALCHAVGLLTVDQRLTLQEGVADGNGAYAVLAAGTGLGMAAAIPTGGSLTVLPSEGGHRDFAPQNEEEWALWQWLHRRYGHVSVERILSGMGLVDLYDFLRCRAGLPEPSWLARGRGEKDGGAVSKRAADDPLARRALELFFTIYGGEAGNVALQYLAVGGVYLAGGIVARLHPHLRPASFLAAFRNKGRMQGLLERVPVHCILDPGAPLLGAAVVARRALTTTCDPAVAKSGSVH